MPPFDESHDAASDETPPVEEGSYLDRTSRQRGEAAVYGALVAVYVTTMTAGVSFAPGSIEPINIWTISFGLGIAWTFCIGYQSVLFTLLGRLRPRPTSAGIALRMAVVLGIGFVIASPIAAEIRHELSGESTRAITTWWSMTSDTHWDTTQSPPFGEDVDASEITGFNESLVHEYATMERSRRGPDTLKIVVYTVVVAIVALPMVIAIVAGEVVRRPVRIKRITPWYVRVLQWSISRHHDSAT